MKIKLSLPVRYQILFIYFCRMFFVDSHTHLYLDQFDDDRKQVIEEAIAGGVEYMLLPNIDLDSVDAMLNLTCSFPHNCIPMMGLHPTSVKDDYQQVLESLERELNKQSFCAIGEIGIDLYWDKTYRAQQEDAFRQQLQMAKKHNLPVSIHTRESFDEIYRIVKEELTQNLTGVFHCFTGNDEQAGKIMDMGFRMGIGGIVTFKNSGIDEVVKNIPMDYLVLETDAPFLAPAPYRGKRNQSAYLPIIAQKVAEIKNISIEKVADITGRNATELFNLNQK